MDFLLSFFQFGEIVIEEIFPLLAVRQFSRAPQCLIDEHILFAVPWEHTLVHGRNDDAVKIEISCLEHTDDLHAAHRIALDMVAAALQHAQQELKHCLTPWQILFGDTQRRQIMQPFEELHDIR